MFKLFAPVIFMLSITNSFGQQIPGMASTKDVVRLSLWYEGISNQRVQDIAKSNQKSQIELSDELRTALFRLKI
jgi:hypothetical protein